MKNLILAVKSEYFDQIKSGSKTEEYRLCNEYWKKRLENRVIRYNKIIITKGYPKKEDENRRLVFPYTGWSKKIITHEHFGNVPVKVYAIELNHNPRF